MLENNEDDSDSWLNDKNPLEFAVHVVTPQDKTTKSTFGLGASGNLFGTIQENRRNQSLFMSTADVDKPQDKTIKQGYDPADSFDTSQNKWKNQKFANFNIVPEDIIIRRNVKRLTTSVERAMMSDSVKNSTKIDSLQTQIPTKIKPGATLKGNKNQVECRSNFTQNYNNFVAQKPKSSNAKLMQKLSTAMTSSASTVSDMIIAVASSIMPTGKNNFRPKDNKVKNSTKPSLELETKRITRQSSKSSEIIIISDDEEETEEEVDHLKRTIDTEAAIKENSILTKMNLSAIANVTAEPMKSVHHKIYSDNNRTPPSHPPAVFTPRCFGYFEVIPLTIVYLGRKVFNSNDKPFSIQIVTAKSRFDLSIYSALEKSTTAGQSTPSTMHNSNILKQQLQPRLQCPMKHEYFSEPEHIPFVTIKELTWGLTEFPEANERCFIAMELHHPSTLLLKYASIGEDCSCDLQPGLITNTPDNPSKYISMLLSLDNMKKFVTQIYHNEGSSVLRDIVNPLSEARIFESAGGDDRPDSSDFCSQSQPMSSDELTAREKDYYLAALFDKSRLQHLQQQKQKAASPIVLFTPPQSQSQTEGRKTRTRNKKRIQQELVLTPEDAETLVLYPWDAESQDVITLCRGDLKRLAPEEYLNDNLIDFKLKFMLLDPGHRYHHTEASTHVHIFSTLFYTKLTEKSSSDRSAKGRHSLVERWTKGVDIFTKKLIFIPINLSGHWSLSVLVNIGNSCETEETADRNMNTTSFDNNNVSSSGSSGSSSGTQQPSLVSRFSPCLLFLDSLSCHPRPTIANILQHYLEQEWKAKYKTDRKFVKMLPVVDCSSWIPHQPNAYDCGLYVIKYAEELYDRMFRPLPSATSARQSVLSMDDFVTPPPVVPVVVAPATPKSQLAEAVKGGLLLGKHCFSDEDVTRERLELQSVLLELSQQWKEYKIAKKRALKKCKEPSELNVNNNDNNSNSNERQSTEDTVESSCTDNHIDRGSRRPSLDSDGDSEMDVDVAETKVNEADDGAAQDTTSTAASPSNNNNDTSPTDSPFSLSSSLSILSQSGKNSGRKTASSNNSVSELLSDDEDDEKNVNSTIPSTDCDIYPRGNKIHSEQFPSASNKSSINENTSNLKRKANDREKRERECRDTIAVDINKNTSENSNSNYSSDSDSVKVPSMDHLDHNPPRPKKKTCTRGEELPGKKISVVFKIKK